MRIEGVVPESALDIDGNVLMTSFSILDMHGPGRSQGALSSRTDEYQGFDEVGEDLSASETATWAVFGEFPDQAFVLLTENELTVAQPSGGDPQLRLWGRWPRSADPDETFGPALDAVKIEWEESLGISGMFGPSVPGSDRVRVISGSVWVMTPTAVTVLDFSQDRAAIYLNSGGVLELPERGLNLDTVPGGIEGVFEGDPAPALAVPCGSYSGLAVWARNEGAFAAVAGDAGVCLLARDYRVPGGFYVPAEHFDPSALFGGDYRPFDVQFLPDGRLLAIGTVGEAPGALWWSIRSEAPTVDGTFGPELWSEPRIPSTGYVATSPRIAVNRDGEVYLSFDRGVLRFSLPTAQLTESTRVDFWAGIVGDDLGVTPRFQSMDRGARVVDLAFDRNIPVIHTDPGPEFGGGSLISVYVPTFRQVVWRRYFRNIVRSIGSSPLRRPDSRFVVPGQTNSPPPNFGPDDLG